MIVKKVATFIQHRFQNKQRRKFPEASFRSILCAFIVASGNRVMKKHVSNCNSIKQNNEERIVNEKIFQSFFLSFLRVWGYPARIY